MPHAIWKGAISFGLVNIPVGLFPAESRDRLRFRLLDRRTGSVVHEERRNDRDEPVPLEDVVKGYQCRDGTFVTLSDDDFARANPAATQNIDIAAFVGRDEIDVTYYERPYYLVPATSARKGYAILREALRRSGRVAVAKVVIRTRQYLAAVLPHGDALVLELLRYAHELRPAEDLDVPGSDLGELGINDRELAVAGQLVEAMTEPWDPERYRDEYRDDLLRVIAEKAQTGRVGPAARPSRPESGGEVVDIMALLKKSVEERRAAEREAGEKKLRGAPGKGAARK